MVGVAIGGLPAAAAPTDEVGTPFLTTFADQDYGAHSQNWAVAQDSRGVMFFGNGNGVLRFDGVDWQTIPATNSSIVRSLDVDRQDTVFVGAVNELGYLRPDVTGTATYVSLLNQLDAEDQNLGDVWQTYATDEGVFFWTRKKLFRWRDQRFASWALDSQMVCCRVEDRIVYKQPGSGLRMLEGDDFRDLVGTESLGEARIVTMLHDGPGRFVAGSRDGRLWKVSWAEDKATDRLVAEITRFPTAVDEALARYKLYTGARLASGDFALATMTGGSFIIDRDGVLRHRFDTSSGLSDDSVWALYVDREQGLWHALNRGLTRVELGTPVTEFRESAGLEGTVEALARYQGALYIATSLGLSRLEGDHLRKISSLEAPYWSLLPAKVADGDGETLLVGTTRGVFKLRDDSWPPTVSGHGTSPGTGGLGTSLVATRNAFQLYQSRLRPEIVYVGDMDGVSVIEWTGGEWRDAGRLEVVDKEVRSLAEDDAGNLWLGTHFDGLMRLVVDHDRDPRVIEIERFDLDHGLPALKSIKVHNHSGKLLFVSPRGLMQFDALAERFEASDLLGQDQRQLAVLRWSPAARGDVWMSLYGGQLAIAWRQSDGSYSVDTDSLRRLAGPSTHAVLPESDGVVWFGGVRGLYRLEADRLGDVAEELSFTAQVRRVSINRPGGDVLFGGDTVQSWEPPVLPYQDGSLRFEYAMARFDGGEANRYRSRLVGLGEAWSDWTDETYRDFTSLREGRYRFEVAGRDVYYRLSEVASFDFRVLPPWYRTWWAYAFYTLAVASAAWTLLSWLLRRQRLEMEVQRLAEANDMMQRSEQERRKFVRELETKNREMERFIYTVSHDLKSPLISIRGFLGLLEKDLAAGEQERIRHDMRRIHTATGKMAHMVEELLELSTVGRQANEPQEVAMDELAREAADQVAGLIAERQAEIIISPEMPPVKGDRQRLQAMLQNLIENGVKYMGEQPSPRIEIDHQPIGEDTVYRVRDNGIGIDPRYQEKIFGLFERLSTATEGTGVGLALVKRIVEVHGGRVWVESEGEGTGSAFCFTLPGVGTEAP